MLDTAKFKRKEEIMKNGFARAEHNTGKSLRKGFTLAEVLITLVIIGVVGALTVPALVQNTRKQEYVTALKKAYSTLSQAANMIIAENGSPKCYDETGSSAGGWACSNEEIYNLFKKHLHNIKECDVSAENGGCFGQRSYKRLDGVVIDYTERWANPYYKALVTADGMQMYFDFYGGADKCANNSFTKNACGFITVDINGEKQPNTLGRDYFEFAITENGLVPAGCGSAHCSGGAWGQLCGCKVLTEGAMNY